MSELKACPFCGKEVELNVFLQEDKDESYFIECHNPDCNYTSADFYTKTDLIKYFNTRPLEYVLQSALTTAQEENKRTIETIRIAVADYMRSEGCSCCRDIDAHEVNTKRLAELLNVSMYDDESGFNFAQFRSESTS
jgi:hypothetical protein